jgi:uncharacterized membrane protein
MKVLKKLKGGLSLLSDKVVKYEKYIYLILIIVIVNSFTWFNITIKHTAELLKSETEKVGLVIKLEQLDNISANKSELINFQEIILLKQEEQLKESNQIMKMQDNALQKLIQYLKNIGEWPPKIKPIDPNRSTRSDAI